MKLTYSDKQFVLHGSLREAAVTNRSEWEQTKHHFYRTQDIRAAAEFRRYADESAERVFQRSFVKHYNDPPASLPPFLDEHQIKGVRWGLSRSRSYLAHAPGAGKTLQAITMGLLTQNHGQSLFIVPPSLTKNWEREVWRWTEWWGGWPSIQVVPETAAQDFVGWDADFLICPDSMLAKPWVHDALISRRFAVLAVDEASRFKEPSSARTVALFGGKDKYGRLYKGLQHRARHTVLMDGSPMPNGRPIELWAPVFATSPETIDFMSQQDFGLRYCGAKMNDHGQWEFKFSAHEEELRRKLQKDFMHVVREEDLNHPERLRSIVLMNKDARSAEHIKWEKQAELPDVPSEKLSQGEFARFRRELGSRKAPWVAQYIRERLESKNESILLFAWHRGVVQALASYLYNFKPGVILGGTSKADREKALKDFNDGKTKLLIGNIDALGRGHNVQKADLVAFAEYSWGDEANKQCEKRASRRGRAAHLPVRCVYIVNPRSMDEMILRSVMRKQKATKKVIG